MILKQCSLRLKVAEKEFLDVFVKMTLAKPPLTGAVRDKALEVLQAWADAFKPTPELTGVRQA
jgi:hypothetical protein